MSSTVPLLKSGAAGNTMSLRRALLRAFAGGVGVLYAGRARVMHLGGVRVVDFEDSSTMQCNHCNLTRACHCLTRACVGFEREMLVELRLVM